MDEVPLARAPADQPYRGPADRCPEVRVPPAHLPLFDRRQLRKKWHYVSFWGQNLALCAADVQVGFLSNEYWAVWDRLEQRRDHQFRTKTHYFRNRVHLAANGIRVDDRVDGQDVSIDLSLETSDTFDVYRPEGRAYIWSRKELCLGAEATVRIGNRVRSETGTAFVDVNAGYHFRRTQWRWAGGAATRDNGEPVAWNAITGLFDTPTNSERTIWVGRRGDEIKPVTFSDDANVVTFEEGGELTFQPAETLRKRIGLFLIKSKYEHAFGVYSGTLPGGIEVRDAVGVRERQDALW